MDIATRLQELTKEIVNFGEVINYTENPVDSDFRNACDLFSQYLNHELQDINANIRFHDTRSDIKQTTSRLHELSDLISPGKISHGQISHGQTSPDQANNIEKYQWSNKLTDFCNQLQSLKNIAA